MKTARRNIFGWLAGKIIIILRVGTSKNKNFDHQFKGICAIISTQVTHETDHISLGSSDKKLSLI